MMKVVKLNKWGSVYELGRGENHSINELAEMFYDCLLYTSPSPRDRTRSRMPSSA
mgnify:CR=1 FL=1